MTPSARPVPTLATVSSHPDHGSGTQARTTLAATATNTGTTRKSGR